MISGHLMVEVCPDWDCIARALTQTGVALSMEALTKHCSLLGSKEAELRRALSLQVKGCRPVCQVIVCSQQLALQTRIIVFCTRQLTYFFFFAVKHCRMYVVTILLLSQPQVDNNGIAVFDISTLTSVLTAGACR